MKQNRELRYDRFWLKLYKEARFSDIPARFLPVKNLTGHNISIENHTYFLILIVWTLFEGNWVDLYVKLLSLRHVFRTESPQKIDILLLSLLQYLSTDILNISVFLLCS